MLEPILVWLVPICCFSLLFLLVEAVVLPRFQAQTPSWQPEEAAEPLPELIPFVQPECGLEVSGPDLVIS